MNYEQQQISDFRNELLIKKCLDSLMSFDKGQLRDELEQLLLALEEKGCSIKELSKYLSKGGCR